jgi:hypothetical protein
VQWCAMPEEGIGGSEFGGEGYCRFPELGLLFAIPNGARLRPAVAKTMKEEGLRRGVLDLCLPVPRGVFHGLWIEMKAPAEPGFKKGYPSPAQKWWIEQLRRQGYAVYVCYTFEEARDVLIDYLTRL